MDFDNQTQRQLEDFRQRMHTTANFYRQAIAVLAADQLFQEAQPKRCKRPSLLRAWGDWAIRLGQWGLGKLASDRFLYPDTVIPTRPQPKASTAQIIVIEHRPSSRKGERNERNQFLVR